MEKAIKTVERECGKSFDPKNPLLFSVRSGARESMPGMMDTILNLGLNDKTVAGLAKLTGNGRPLAIAIADSFKCTATS